ncbi:MAG TPA: phycobiliprotein lyase [Trichocoleus sp.]
MPFSTDTAHLLAESLVEAFFKDSEGDWQSERRYYTLKSGETQQVVSQIQIRFLPEGSEELIHLAGLHELRSQEPLVCGAKVTWASDYIDSSKKTVEGSTVFGVRGSTLFRDRGFATSKPVTAYYLFPDPRTMRLRTEYQGSAFEEEIKLIGKQYRTRQTIISRAGEEIMIGQYLEKRL